MTQRPGGRPARLHRVPFDVWMVQLLFVLGVQEHGACPHCGAEADCDRVGRDFECIPNPAKGRTDVCPVLRCPSCGAVVWRAPYLT